MITMVQVTATVNKSWVRLGLYKDNNMLELTINGQTINVNLQDYVSDAGWTDTIIALKEAVANL